jgi:hypothetical protein
MHIDFAMTDVSVAFQNGAFVAEEVFPTVPSDYQSNDYWQYGMEKFRRRVDNRAPGTRPTEAGWSAAAKKFYCEGHALRGVYPWEMQPAGAGSGGADPTFDLDVDVTENTTDQVLLAQECNLVDAVKASCPIVDLSLNGGENQLDNPNFDWIAFMDRQKETVAKSIGKTPNTLVMGRPAFRAGRNNPQALKHIYGTTVLAPEQMIGAQQLAQKLEIERVLIAEAMYDTANEGSTAALDYIWGDLALLCYVAPKPGRRQVSLGYHFLWTVGNQGRIVEKWYDQDTKRYVIDVHKYYAQQMIASGAGLLFTNTSSADAGGEAGA